MRSILKVAMLCLLWAAASAMAAEGYPNRPIRLIVPYPAGGSTNDILGRTLAQRLSDELGQNVIVDNRGGAGGVIGTEIAAKALPDGYTVIQGTNGPFAVMPHLVAKMPYDPVRDFQAVAMYAIVPYAIAVNPSVPAKDLREFVAYARARPGKVFFGTAGIASTPHLCGELLNLAGGVELVTVHYKGGAPAVIDTIAGQVQMYCSGLAPLIPQAKSGKLRILAVTTPQRSQSMPELPTADSQGLTGFDVNSWNGIFVPRGTPPAVVKRLHDAVAKIMETPEMKRYMLEQGLEIAVKGPAEFEAYLRAESEKWGRVIKAAGIRAE